MKIIERNGRKYIELEFDRILRVREFAILKNLEIDEERRMIPMNEVLAVITEGLQEPHFIHRFTIRWGQGNIFFRVVRGRISNHIKAYYTPCEKQFIKYCEKKGVTVYLDEDVYHDPDDDP